MKNVVLSLLVVAIICVPSALPALTPPGTVLTSDANVTYADDDGKSYTGNSNAVSLTVAARTVSTKLNVYSDPVNPTTPDGGATTLPGTPGDTLYVPISYTNGGDAPDKYTISAYGVVPSDYVVSFISDDNDDSIRQTTETTECTETPWIDANTTAAKSFVAITLPLTAILDSDVSITIRAASRIDPSGPLGVGYDEATLKLLPMLPDNGPRLTITALSDKTTALPNETYTVTYVVKNEGNDVAQSISLFAAIPADTVVESSVPAGSIQTDGTAYIIPLPELAVGQETIVTVVYRVL